MSKQEAIRLRLEERKSIIEIMVALGRSKSTVYHWLRDLPLSPEERRIRKIRSGSVSRRSKARALASPSKFYLAVKASELDRNRKGRIAEAAVLFRLALLGFDVYGRMFDGQKADWVVDGVKLQVRFSCWTRRGGLPVTSLRCGGGPRNTKKRRRLAEDEFDILVGYDLYTDTAFVWDREEVQHLRSGISACPEAAERWDKIGLLVQRKNASSTR